MLFRWLCSLMNCIPEIKYTRRQCVRISVCVCDSLLGGNRNTMKTAFIYFQFFLYLILLLKIESMFARALNDKNHISMVVGWWWWAHTDNEHYHLPQQFISDGTSFKTHFGLMVLLFFFAFFSIFMAFCVHAFNLNRFISWL